MKKNKLIVSYAYEFTLLGVASNSKDYKLAWAINQLLRIKLVKAADLVIETRNDKNIVISNFIFETEHSIFRLLKNKSFDKSPDGPGYLVPELRNFDYFIWISGFEDTFTLEEFVESLRRINEIQFLQKIEVTNIKSKENLIF